MVSLSCMMLSQLEAVIEKLTEEGNARRRLEDRIHELSVTHELENAEHMKQTAAMVSENLRLKEAKEEVASQLARMQLAKQAEQSDGKIQEKELDKIKQELKENEEKHNQEKEKLLNAIQQLNMVNESLLATTK